MAGNGFRAARAVPELEQRTGRLVLQANQVLLWFDHCRHTRAADN